MEHTGGSAKTKKGARGHEFPRFPSKHRPRRRDADQVAAVVSRKPSARATPSSVLSFGSPPGLSAL